jgi:hypothetical protein
MGRRGARDSLVEVKRAAVSGGVVVMMEEKKDVKSLLLVIREFDDRDCVSPGFGRDRGR